MTMPQTIMTAKNRAMKTPIVIRSLICDVFFLGLWAVAGSEGRWGVVGSEGC
jgi:hypothetical protein